MRAFEDAWACISQLVGVRAWGVKRGLGSFLTFEFGPQMDGIHGKWHLWVYCCDWVVAVNGQCKGTSSDTSKEIDQIIAEFEGLVFRNLIYQPSKGKSCFQFSSNYELICESGDYHDEEQWMLFFPERTISLLNNGEFMFEDRITPE